MTLFDELAEKLGYYQWNEWKAKVLDAKEEIAAFVASRRPGRGAEVLGWFQGSFNFCLQITYNDGTPDVMIRFPGPGHTTSQDEKIRNEVQVIMFLHESTSIPVPRLFSWGLTEDSPQHLGPFMISEFVEGVHLFDVLKDPADPKRLHLNPNIDRNILDNMYTQPADIMLQLCNADFDRIGAISKDTSSGSWCVTERPLTYTMNELANTAFFPVEDFPSTTFTSASDYFHGPFKLFCDDFRPQNILVGPETLRTKAVLDLEFTNAMLRQFASDAPWWLLLVGPDSYLLRDRTLGEFVEAYEPRLEHFLQVMERVEGARDGGAGGAQPLSRLMRESWDTKRFWFTYAARKPFDVEVFFDEFLNERNAGIGSLDEDAREGLKSFVEMKMKQLRAYDDECSRAL
ncbi:hypothetical protein G6514_008741 [Epicoccum nigrum]|nr:hypothetical protein G6514_008741 [Epicoccum nigrum]